MWWYTGYCNLVFVRYDLLQAKRQIKTPLLWHQICFFLLHSNLTITVDNKAPTQRPKLILNHVNIMPMTITLWPLMHEAFMISTHIACSLTIRHWCMNYSLFTIHFVHDHCSLVIDAWIIHGFHDSLLIINNLLSSMHDLFMLRDKFLMTTDRCLWCMIHSWFTMNFSWSLSFGHLCMNHSWFTIYCSWQLTFSDWCMCHS